MRNKLLLLFGVLLALTTFTKIPHTLSASANSVPNDSVETVDPTNNAKPQDWMTDNWGTNTAAFSLLQTGHSGNKSLKVEVTKYTSGDSKWYYTPQPATAGTKYFISDYYQSNVVSRVVVMFNLQNNTQSYLELPTAAASPSSWANYDSSVVAPANTVSMSVFHLISRVGWLITDDYSVTTAGAVTPTPTVTPTNTPTNTPTPSPTSTATPTATPSPTASPTSTPTPTSTSTPTGTPIPTGNVIPNPSLENQSSNTIPSSWIKESWGKNKATFTYQKNVGHNGSRSVKVQLASYVDGDVKWYFNPVNVTPGDTYTFTDWYQSNVLSHVVIDFENTDSSHYYLELKTAPISASWTKHTESFQVPQNAKKMTAFHMITANGWLITDDYSVARSVPSGFDKARITFDFDDGWEEDSLTALPILNQHGYKGSFFFATTFLSSSPLVGPIGVSGPATVKAIFSQGHEVGGHTVTHPDLTTLSANNLNTELLSSKTYLESLVGNGNIKDFASPFGAYNDLVISAIKPLYLSHRPTDEGFNTKENLDPYRLKVQNMQKTTTLAEFTSWVNQAVKDKSWLILVYHRVTNTDLDQWDTPLTDFPLQMQVVQNSGITVQTTRQALNDVLSQ